MYRQRKNTGQAVVIQGFQAISGYAFEGRIFSHVPIAAMRAFGSFVSEWSDRVARSF
jgi:hypothetical protein